ncbi:hypothetical protein LTR37_016420 [Vermiconidia calcicola]|uniref:Uncharacterized protein n=1 Tax=Vermiconidia calcicola TaxID=1690605 RepID=A0ACC3MPC4_9PEZI|nr:hypothetical protein LTR37_016420 [Vermiconidia calcicola]
MVQVFLKALDGKTYTIETELDDSCWNFALKIQQRVGMPPEQMRLIFNGKPLSLGKHEVEDEGIGEPKLSDLYASAVNAVSENG